jgi:FAD/FMN-containing dehydrogenase
LLPTDLPYYVIVEAMGAHPQHDDEIFAGALESLLASGRVIDGVVAKSDKERKAIWGIREEVEWLISRCFNFDVSLPVVDVADYVEIVSAGIVADVPGAFVAAFGHLGDNNIHLSVLVEENKDAYANVIQEHVYRALVPYSGAISAEHGIGLEKRAYLGISRTAAEIELMHSLKTMLDPNNILNPGKVIDLP